MFNFLLRASCLMMALAGISVSVMIVRGIADVAKPGVAGGEGLKTAAASCAGGDYARALSALAGYEMSFVEGRLDDVDAGAADALQAVRHSLACAPAAPDLWTAAARIVALNEGVDDLVLNYLRMSCKTGPTQEWNAAARLGGFGSLAPSLPADLRACLENDRMTVALAHPTSP